MMQLMTALAIAAFMLNFVLLSGHFELDGAECSDFHPESKQYFLDKHPWHQITRRQAAGGDEMPTTTTTNAAQDTEYCDTDFIWSNVYCSSGAAQNSVNNYLRCGYNVTYVRSRFDTCVRSEGGTFCGSIEFTADMEQYLEGNCSEAIATNSSCSPLCHTHLENFKRKFGCCINAYLNGTYSTSIRRGFDYQLWNLCRVQLPSTDCENNGLIFNQPNTQMNCSDPYGIQDLVIFCSPNVIPLFINGLLNNTNSRCSLLNRELAKNYSAYCSTNAEGDLCISVLYRLDMTIFQYVSMINSSCAREIDNSTGGCAPICRNTLMEVKDALGCCLNSAYYNLSENAVPKPLAYRLWNSCGVETPGICENLIRFVGAAGSTSTTQSPPKPSHAAGSTSTTQSPPKPSRAAGSASTTQSPPKPSRAAGSASTTQSPPKPSRAAGSASTTQSPPKPSRAKSTTYNVIPVTVLWASTFTWNALVTLAPDIQN